MSHKRKLKFRPLWKFTPGFDAREIYHENVRSHPAIRALPRAKRRKRIRALARLGITGYRAVRFLKAGKVVAYQNMS